MDKSPEKQKVEKKIGQLQNRQKILLNRKRSEEHWARTHRLIGRGALLEAVFPAVVEMEGEDAKAFLIALSRLPGAAELAEKAPKTRLRSNPQSEWRTYTPSRCRARVVAKSAQLHFRLRRKLRSLPCSSFPHKACGFAGTPGLLRSPSAMGAAPPNPRTPARK